MTGDHAEGPHGTTRLCCWPYGEDHLRSLPCWKADEVVGRCKELKRLSIVNLSRADKSNDFIIDDTCMIKKVYGTTQG